MTSPNFPTVTVALACFLHYPGPNLPMAVFFTVAEAFHAAIVIVCFANLSARRRKSLLYKVYSWCRGWYPSHALGLTLLALPALCALANFQCERLRRGGLGGHGGGESREMYLQLCFFGVVHFTNLTALSNWAKSAFASLTAVVILG